MADGLIVDVSDDCNHGANSWSCFSQFVYGTLMQPMSQSSSDRKQIEMVVFTTKWWKQRPFGACST